jgi:hypothetical protein
MEEQNGTHMKDGNLNMTTDKQLKANRYNSTKSTGPRSQAGKARSRLNSRRHGLTAKTLIIVGENAEDFDQLRAELFEEYDPRSALQIELVERLSGILWRLRRVPIFEAAILGALHAQADEEKLWSEMGNHSDEEEDEEKADRGASVHLGVAFMKDGWNDALGKLARHETTLMNALAKTLQMLLLLQQQQKFAIEAAPPTPNEH